MLSKPSIGGKKPKREPPGEVGASRSRGSTAAEGCCGRRSGRDELNFNKDFETPHPQPPPLRQGRGEPERCHARQSLYYPSLILRHQVTHETRGTSCRTSYDYSKARSSLLRPQRAGDFR